MANYSFASVSGTTLSGFVPGSDFLVFPVAYTAARMFVEPDGVDTVIHYGLESVRLAGVASSVLRATQFRFEDGTGYLYARGGPDTLVGGTGDDHLNGNGGDDILEGRMGSDTFGYRTDISNGTDRIKDFGAGDRIFFRSLQLTDIVPDGDLGGLAAGQVMVGTAVSGSTPIHVQTGGELLTIQLDGQFSNADFGLSSDDTGWWIAMLPPAPLVGTVQDDHLAGSEASEIISGLAGDDTLEGQGGDDTLLGGEGNDRLTGGGPGESNLLIGGPGDDTLAGGIAVYSFAGQDEPVVFASAIGGRFLPWSGSQADGLGGTDTLVGIANLHVVGGNAGDHLTGGIESNELEGGGGDDTLTGGGGSSIWDVFVFRVGTGELGRDRITDLTSSERLHFPGFPLDPVVRPGNGDGLLRSQVAIGAYDAAANTTQVFIGTDAAPGGDLAITLTGRIRSNDLWVSNIGHGNLIYRPGLELAGTAGNDSIRGGGNHDTLSGLAGDDYLYEVSGIDFGNDMLLGGSGNDVLDGGVGNDHLEGGDDNDVLNGDVGDDWIDGGAGQDLLQFEGFAPVGGVTVDLSLGMSVGSFGNDTLVGIENVEGTSSADTITGDGGQNLLNGGYGDDRLSGMAGDDQLTGAVGNDTINGGEGYDTAVFQGNRADHALSFGSGGIVVAGSAGTDGLAGVERLIFLDGTVHVYEGAEFDAMRYGASNVDLIAAYGANIDAFARHYFFGGAAEGRLVNFDALRYVASNPDLIPSLGTDVAAATAHYVNTGYAAGLQVNFDALRYVASNPDLIPSLGANAAAATRHYIESGHAGVRHTDSFDGLRYVASYTDLIAAYGVNGAAGTVHYVSGGHAEGRTVSFDPYSYLAANADLMSYYGANPLAATYHYIQGGHAEGRTFAFDALRYVASHADLVTQFGPDLDGATRHYVETGFQQGRAMDFEALRYTASHADLIAAFGTDVQAATQHYVTTGHAAGQTASFDVLQYALANPDLLAHYQFDRAGLAAHYILAGHAEGRVTTLAATQAGGEGNDLVAGGAGADQLAGGAGVDMFLYLSTAEGGDTITDFVAGIDKLAFSADGFDGLALGTLRAAYLSDSSAGLGNHAGFIYDAATGGLSYDADGAGSGAAAQIALLGEGHALAANDILITA